MAKEEHNFDKLKAMKRLIGWLCFTCVVAATLLVVNMGLAVFSGYRVFMLGNEDSVLGLLSALGGVTVAAVLFAYKFRDLGRASANFLREARFLYESIEGSNTLCKRYRNFRRARKAAAELML